MIAIDVISKYGPCEEAIIWLEDRTIDQMVDECPIGEWLMWLANQIGISSRLMTLAKARCAKTVKHLMIDNRSIAAVEVAERYGLGEATYKELSDALNEARDAVNESEYGYPHYAATAAEYALCTDNSDAESTAYAAATAASYMPEHNAEKDNQLLTANICREVFGETIKSILKTQ